LRPSFIAISYEVDEEIIHALINIDDISSVQQIDGCTSISMRPDANGMSEYFPIHSVYDVIVAMIKASASVVPVGKGGYPEFLAVVNESSQ
jgi:hypothetical protein